MAILAADGTDASTIQATQITLKAESASAEIIAPHLGTLQTTDGKTVTVDRISHSNGSLHYGAVFVPGRTKNIEMLQNIGEGAVFIDEAFKHGEPIATISAGSDLIAAANLKGATIATDDSDDIVSEQGVITGAKDT